MFDMVAYEYAVEAAEQGLTAEEGALFVHAMVLEELLNGGRFFALESFLADMGGDDIARSD